VSERVLTTRELNRALLARQLFLGRSRLPLVRAVEQIGGLQTQYAPSAYIGLWSRLEGFGLDDLTQALERRRAIQATLMRSTIHVVSRRDYWPFAVAIRADQRAWWTRVHKRLVGDVDLDGAARVVREALADGTRHRDELLELTRPFDPKRGTAVWNGLPLDLVRIPPSGTWERRRADLYALAESWVGAPAVEEDEARVHLLRRYLAGFGPASLNDAADWAGVRVATLRPAAERLRLRTFRDESGKLLLDLPRAPLPPAETPAPVRFIGTWDANLLVHARRTQFLPERFRPLIFSTKTPHSFPTFLVDGSVAGTWRVERTKAKAALLLSPFERLPRAARTEVHEEAERLVRLHEGDATSYAVRWA
jgi:Winged helix DNA-binding domain